MTRVAAIDCGTNSIRLLVSELREGSIADVTREMKVVRLGEGVDATGAFAPEALERVQVALEQYVETMEDLGVTTVRMVATSASRDVSNRDEFFRMTGSLLGRIRPGYRAEVISGEEEAALSFRGAVADLDPQDGPFCVMDLGGGSTEFVVGDADGSIFGSHSTRMGCVRLSERIMRSDPPTATEVEIAEDYVAERIKEVETIVPITQAQTFVGCAGTFTTLAALALGLESYDPKAIHNAVLRTESLHTITRQLIAESAAERLLHPVMHPGRADVIAGGSVVVEGIIEMIHRNTSANTIVISEKDILDGIVAQLFEQRSKA
ncbi:Ppx/GppA phosphatase family protein [Corynebacterium pelargi]|uniref:Guanosine-5'-triphosphate,3'-diphosphate pyrophosphatase n=1 Tax=Corynebacterium pelargi TaxID=1471400 RepID=A0A410W9U3_9CORY|nr:Ppx/GppA phosphatase family protein [Corynebacterium pelargi]QAU52719.1 Guanosine-5'-triphosphate,3'-diphosphate pyrophosphatase [Corynebacterium pelargi]GGG78349.1 exopolyphosphatase [Corynebacterium pelargi]